MVASLGAPTNGSVLYLDPPRFLPGAYSVKVEPILPQKGGPSITGSVYLLTYLECKDPQGLHTYMHTACTSRAHTHTCKKGGKEREYKGVSTESFSSQNHYRSGEESSGLGSSLHSTPQTEPT